MACILGITHAATAGDERGVHRRFDAAGGLCVCFWFGGSATCFVLPVRGRVGAGEQARCTTGSRWRALAQLAEHRSPKPKVGGSSPSCPARHTEHTSNEE